jgi:beta-lactamase superfamily II metal-dependent hydrolase
LKLAKKGDFVLCALNAGQGDCCVMRLPDGKIIVVDCNVTSANVNVVKFLEKAGVKEIELLVLTHPDRDHVSGLPGLVDSIKIKNVIDGRFRKETEDGERTPGYESYRQAIEKLKASGTNFLPRTALRGDS